MLNKRKFGLKERNVIVTGASSGLGKEMTLLLIRRYGCRVLGVARNEQKLRWVKTELGELSDRFEYMALDVSRRESWTKLARFVSIGKCDCSRRQSYCQSSSKRRQRQIYL